ncbi:hypothetical protein E3N88_16837 [Mikania micrantha]|uniref:TmcB/TmcC TPR repeats domain-containing protein n=1 Tax=Mikania micrantha TaxID=192012 RepID=A0A5N6NQ92_9ASTR|nr:hypothetical protein E3N88_16837 [Mikania micrantha]
MASFLLRTGSGPIDSTRFSVAVRHDFFSGFQKFEFCPLLHLEANNRRRISRAVSDPHTIIRSKSVNAGPLPEEVKESLPDEDAIGRIGSLKFAEKCFDRISAIPAGGIALDEAQLPGFGSGSGRGRRGFGSGGSNNNNDRNKIGAHYKKLLESNPNDPLLLRNYGKFLQEIEGDTVKAEEHYERAILASPGDGELLSLYGKLIWDSRRDGERAQYYFDQAVSASPGDCMVMGSYAQFMWESEEDEDEEESGSKVAAF